MRNSSTGAFEVYDINNNMITSASAIGQVGNEWQVAGFGPFNGPGTSDLVLRNTNTGAFEVYDIANNQITGASLLGTVGLDWQLGGFAADPPTAFMGNSGSQLGSAGSTSQLVQAMASFSESGVAAMASSPINQASLDATSQTAAISLSANSLGAAHI